MIKLESNIFYKKGIVAFAAEASSEKDLPTLDLLAEALSEKPNIEVGFVTTNRLVFQIKNMRESIFKKEDGSLIKNI